METFDFIKNTKELLETFEIDYRIELTTEKRTIGTCWNLRKLMTFSIHFIERNDWQMMRKTVLHEIAHALNWKRNHLRGHDREFYRICQELGIPQRRLNNEIITPEYRYDVIDTTTGEIVHGYHRYPNKMGKTIHRAWVKGRKKETEGKLILRKNW